MESPRPLEDAKQVRWVGRPSEEQLLGPLTRPLREVPLSFEPPPPPEWDLGEASAADDEAVAARHWRLGPRDLFALAAVAAAVWLAVRGSEGLPFRSSEPATPPAAGRLVRTALAPDRLDLKRTTGSPTAKTTDAQKSQGLKDRKDQNGSTRPSGKDDPPTDGGADGKTKPLLEATIPGVGTVTVDQPELPPVPDVVPALPAVPDIDNALPDTSTLRLP